MLVPRVALPIPGPVVLDVIDLHTARRMWTEGNSKANNG